MMWGAKTISTFILSCVFCTKPAICIVRHPYPPKLTPLPGLIILRRYLLEKLRQLHTDNALFEVFFKEEDTFFKYVHI